VPLLLVRHAKAGSRREWKGDDRERPLSKAGCVQAGGLVPVLAPFATTRLLSSPYVRCVQTLEPLADPTGLEVERADELGEGRAGKAIVLVRSLVDGPTVALSTHGDIVPAVLEALAEEDGMELPKHPQWPKASTWVLHAHKGRFVKAEYLPPPG
jgi:8-oxo-dGTP diphosphatase